MSWFSKKEKPQSDTEKRGLLGRLFEGLSKSSSKLAGDITAAFTAKRLDQDALDALEESLIRADLGAAAAARIIAKLAKDKFGRDVTDEEVRAALAEEIEAIMRPREVALDLSNGPKPRAVLMIGVNGSGKTTTIGKLAAQLTKNGAKVVIAAGDTFRAAAIEQLQTWAARAGAAFVSRPHGADAAGVAYEALERGRAENADIVFIDTAGRLSNKTELMAELVKIVRVLRKLDAEAPHETLLVLDATVGQNALNQLEAFRSAADVTGLVMTKLDGTAKGGVLVAIAERHALPIHFIGVGETAEDLQPFDARAFSRALVGLS
jgi:fused signal recognition particle receptor